jgi:hypothetical protein
MRRFRADSIEDGEFFKNQIVGGGIEAAIGGAAFGRIVFSADAFKAGLDENEERFIPA